MADVKSRGEEPQIPRLDLSPVPCYNPLHGYLCQDGFRMMPRGDCKPQTVPCGQCVGCRLERSRQWAIRCMHEASLYERNCFLTLTYNEEHIPYDQSLHYDHFQKFMKRLRFSHQGHRPVADGTRPIRFYMCGEYGENFGRPHFHACIFNFDFEDKTLWQKTGSGSKIYRSATLEELWPFGYSSIGSVNFSSAAYVSRYIMKKITGRQADDHYEWVHPLTGEILQRRPEFNKMSLKPGIGADWYDKYKDEVYPHDRVIVNGKAVKPPKYYDKKFKEEYPVEWDEVEFNRWERAKISLDDNSPERLKAKEQVAVANLSRLSRKLK